MGITSRLNRTGSCATAGNTAKINMSQNAILPSFPNCQPLRNVG
jgi:hypothetical protein